MARKAKTQAQAQIGMEDNIIDDPELEKVLEARQEAKEAVGGYRKLDKEAKAKIASIEAETPFRVGRFLISRSTVQAKSVEFETPESVRLNIKLAGE